MCSHRNRTMMAVAARTPKLVAAPYHCDRKRLYVHFGFGAEGLDETCCTACNRADNEVRSESRDLSALWTELISSWI